MTAPDRLPPPPRVTASDVSPQRYPAPTNGLGIAGFVVSIAGILSCGLLAPIGLVISAIAARKEPRGIAIAGVVIGVVGLVELAVGGLAVGMAYLGVKKVSTVTASHVATYATLTQARQALEGQRRADQALPTAEAGTTIVGRFQDGWGRSLVYEREGDSFRIVSLGADGIFGTADDIDLDDPFLGAREESGAPK